MCKAASVVELLQDLWHAVLYNIPYVNVNNLKWLFK